jgi:CheY-like chemotaxis protein
MNSGIVRVLAIEDDEVDLMALKRAFAKVQLPYELYHAQDGLAALHLLRGEQGQPRLAGPLIVLLDLNLPRMDGLEFLHAIRRDPALKALVVFVLTTSAAADDRTRAYAAQIAGYITKTDASHRLPDLVQLLALYWRIVDLP